MSDFTMEVDRSLLAELETAIEGTRKDIAKESANAINKTTGKVKTEISKGIRKEINIPASYMRGVVSVKGRATAAKPSATVVLDHEKRPGVGGKTRRFNPKQNGRGTAFSISKRKGRQTMPGAFMGPRPGALALKLHGGVFIRQNQGDPRSKLIKVHGVSPWATYLKSGMDKRIRKATEKHLHEQLQKRIDTILRNKKLA